MNPLLITIGILLWVSLGHPHFGHAAEPASPSSPERIQGSPDLTDPSLPVYKPRGGKTPRARVGGVARGSGGKDPVVVALVPDHVGLTNRREPCLYWYLSQVTTLPVIFTLREDEAVRPILEVPVKPPQHPGIQVIRLKDFGIELKEEVAYRWFISLQRDPDSPSQDIVTGGMIERVPFVEALAINLAYTGPSDNVRLYADAGLWYDALTAISDQIDASPDDPIFRRQRAALLKQVGLSEIAEAELSSNGKH